MSRTPRSQLYRERVQAFLDEWAERGLTPWQQFRNWSVHQVLWDYGLSMEEIDDITKVDRTRDKGIDGWYSDDEASPNRLILVQSKDTSIDRSDFSKMEDGFLDLVLPGRPPGVNKALQEKASLFKAQLPPTFELHLYLTTSTIAPQNLTPEPGGEPLYQSTILLGEATIPVAHYVRDIKYLVENLQVLHNEPIQATFKLRQREFFRFDVGGHTRTVTAALPALDLARLFNKHRHNLFRKNPRYYLGTSVGVNSQLRAALLGNQNEDFFIYNNGLTCVAKAISLPKPESDVCEITCEDFQIVNGCQTTASIWSAYNSTPPASLTRVRVIAKIVENPRAGSEEDKVSDDIAERSNSQNPLRAEDWKANDRRQQIWQEELRRRKPDPWFYEIKRGTWGYLLDEDQRKIYKDQTTGKYRRIGLKDLGQECWAFLGEPAAAKDRARQIFKDPQIYNKVFDASLKAVQLLLPHLVFEQAERQSKLQPTIVARFDEGEVTEATIDTEHVRFPCVLAVSRMLQAVLGGASGYRTASESEILITTSADWLEVFVKTAMDTLGSALADAVRQSNSGPRAIVRRNQWMGQSVRHACELVKVRVETEQRLGGSPLANVFVQCLRASEIKRGKT